MITPADYVRFTPKSGHRYSVAECPLCAKADSFMHRSKRALFDQLVSALQERFRNCQPDRLGSRQINDKIEPSRLLDRDVAGLRSAQNLVDILGGVPKLSQEVWSVGHKASGLDKIPCIKDCR